MKANPFLLSASNSQPDGDVDSVIFAGESFYVEVPTSPHVDRADGGHLIIRPKVPVKDRTQLSAPQAVELVKLTMLFGAAMQTALNKRGIDVVRINYQDNGNWGFHNADGPTLHIHLYGRARSSRYQKHGEALFLPRMRVFYEGMNPLDDADISEICREVHRLLGTEKYRQFCNSGG